MLMVETYPTKRFASRAKDNGHRDENRSKNSSVTRYQSRGGHSMRSYLVIPAKLVPAEAGSRNPVSD